MKIVLVDVRVKTTPALRLQLLQHWLQPQLLPLLRLDIKFFRFFWCLRKALEILWQTTEPKEKKTVLVFNSYRGFKPPVLIDSTGRQDTNILMLVDSGSQIHFSCSVQWRNDFYIYGGNSKVRQISKVDKCQLKPVGSLEFDHYLGSCSNMNNQQIYLCFDYYDNKRCRSTYNPLGNFTEISLSTFEHRYIRTAASESKWQWTWFIKKKFSVVACSR